MPQKTVVDKSIRDLVIRRAKELDPSFGVHTICLGVDTSGENVPTFYFLAPGKYNAKLMDELARIDLEVARPARQCISMALWPITADQAKNYPFLGEVIYSI